MKVGTICWQDLTVPDAESVRDFYQAVIGWETRPEDMGGYSDYHMLPPGSQESVTGICHARESNAGMPAQWLLYIVVENVERSAARCVELGGEVVHGPRLMGLSPFCVIQDPAGAMCALIEAPPQEGSA